MDLFKKINIFYKMAQEAEDLGGDTSESTPEQVMASRQQALTNYSNQLQQLQKEVKDPAIDKNKLNTVFQKLQEVTTQLEHMKLSVQNDPKAASHLEMVNQLLKAAANINSYIAAANLKLA